MPGWFGQDSGLLVIFNEALGERKEIALNTGR